MRMIRVAIAAVMFVGMMGCTTTKVVVPEEPPVVTYPQDAEQCREHPEYPWCQSR